MPGLQVRRGVAVMVLALLGCASDPVVPEPMPILAIGVDSVSARVSPTRTATVRALVTASTADMPVTVSVAGVPAGVQVAVGEVESDGILSIASLELRADVSAVPGQYPITVTARADGAADATTTFRLRVADLVRVSTAECTAANGPLWFAVQDGSGPLRELPRHNNEFRFAPDEAHAGFYYVIAEADSFSTRGVLKTTAELLAAPIHLCEPALSPGIPATGLLAGLNNSERVYLTLGGPVDTMRANGPFTVMSGTGSLHDLIAVKFGFLSSEPNQFLMRRDVDLAVSSLGMVDMGNPAEAFGVASALMTFENGPPQYIVSQVQFHSGPACRGVPLYNLTSSANSFFTYRRVYGVPASKLRPTDWHRVVVGGGYPDLSVTLWSREIAPFHIARGPEPPYPTVQRLGDRPGLRYALDIPATYDRAVVLYYATWRAIRHDVRIEASRGWMLAEGDRFTSPDFAATPGWNAGWEPDFANHEVYWTTRYVGGPGGAPCTAGVHEWAAEYWGTSWS